MPEGKKKKQWHAVYNACLKQGDSKETAAKKAFGATLKSKK